MRKNPSGIILKAKGYLYQSLSYKTTISAVVKLIPSPPARVVSKKMNFSESGLLYSSIAIIRSSCAVPPSIRQYSELKKKHGQKIGI